MLSSLLAHLLLQRGQRRSVAGGETGLQAKRRAGSANRAFSAAQKYIHVL
jgi:hypothetical protein